MKHFSIKLTLALGVILASSSLSARTFEQTVDPAENNALAIQRLALSIEQANSHPGPDTIILIPEATYRFNSAQSYTANGLNALPFIKASEGEDFGELTIIGDNTTFLRDDANVRFRFMNNSSSGRLILKGITFENGASPDSSEGEILEGGGAIINFGRLDIDDCTFTRNHGKSVGGAIYQKGGSARLFVNNTIFQENYTELYGGAVDSTGAINRFENCEFIGNTAGHFGGAFGLASGESIIENCQFSKNSADQGGAIRAHGPIEINQSTFADNKANRKGGALFIVNREAQVIIKDSHFHRNESENAHGGAIDNYNGTLTIERSHFIHNRAKLSGGAVSSGGIANIDQTNFLSNHTQESGGGVNNASSMTVLKSNFKNNSAAISGGAIANQIHPVNGAGVGIYRSNIISTNICDSDEDGTGDGGGIAHIGDIGKIIVSDNTVFENIDHGGEGNDVSGFFASHEDGFLTSKEGSEGLEFDLDEEERENTNNSSTTNLSN